MIAKQELNIVSSMKDFYERSTTLIRKTNAADVVRRIFHDENLETKYKKAVQAELQMEKHASRRLSYLDLVHL